MNQYELTFLLETEEEVKSVQDLITALKGKILKEEAWGKKALSYRIKKHRSAFYYHNSFDIDRKNIQELRKKLNFNEKIIRYLLLKADLD